MEQELCLSFKKGMKSLCTVSVPYLWICFTIKFSEIVTIHVPPDSCHVYMPKSGLQKQEGQRRLNDKSLKNDY
jgi:hypothetical protein